MDSSSSVWWYGCKEGFSYRGTSRLNLVRRNARAVAHANKQNRNKMEFVVMCSRHFLRFRMQEQWQRLCFSVLLFRLDFSSLSLRLKNRRTRSGTRREMLNICNFIIIHPLYSSFLKKSHEKQQQQQYPSLIMQPNIGVIYPKINPLTSPHCPPVQILPSRTWKKEYSCE